MIEKEKAPGASRSGNKVKAITSCTKNNTKSQARFPESMSRDEHLSLLKRAIEANLRSRLQFEARWHEKIKDNPIEIKTFSVGELMRADPSWLHLDEVIEDPIRKALRAQLKSLGQTLFDLVGSTDEMRKIAEEIASTHSQYYSCIDIIDKNWDGVGSDDYRWWA